MNPAKEPPRGHGQQKTEAALAAYLEDLRLHGEEPPAEEISQMRRALEILSASPLEPTPSGWLEEAVKLVASASRPGAGVRQLAARVMHEGARVLREVRGTLVLDTHSALLPAVRSQRPQAPRQVLLAYPAGKLYLQIDGDESGATVSGQYVPESRGILPEERAVVLTGLTQTWREPLDASGEFRLEGVAREAVELRIEWGDEALVLDAIRL